MSYVDDEIMADPCFYNDPEERNQKMDFSKYDKMVDLDGLQKDIEAASENEGSADYKEVPTGSYEVAITKLELTETKKTGKPMVSCWMKIVSEGDYKGQMIFMNQVVTQGFQFHIMNEFLRSLVESLDIKVEFKSYSQYAELLMDIAEAVDGSFEYGLEYGENKKGYNTFKIVDVFEIE